MAFVVKNFDTYAALFAACGIRSCLDDAFQLLCRAGIVTVDDVRAQFSLPPHPDRVLGGTPVRVGKPLGKPTLFAESK